MTTPPDVKLRFYTRSTRVEIETKCETADEVDYVIRLLGAIRPFLPGGVDQREELLEQLRQNNTLETKARDALG